MTVEQAIIDYRIGLIEAITLLLFFMLAFGAITIAGRAMWAGLKATESLLARIAAALVLGSIAAGGTSGVIVTVLQPTVLSDVTGGTAAAARNQAILLFALALAITIAAVIRLERYNRTRAGLPAADEEADWKVEPPATGRR